MRAYSRAYGISMADVTRHVAAGVYRPYREAQVAELNTIFDRLTAAPRQEILAEGISPDKIEVRRLLDLRYRGVESCLTIAAPTRGTYAEAYAAEHHRLYGYVHDRPLEIVAARVEVIGRTDSQADEVQQQRPRRPTAQRTVAAWFEGRRQASGVFTRKQLHPGDRITGPVIICEPTSTTVVDPGWEGQVLGRGELCHRVPNAAIHDRRRGWAAGTAARSRPMSIR